MTGWVFVVLGGGLYVLLGSLLLAATRDVVLRDASRGGLLVLWVGWLAAGVVLASGLSQVVV